MLVSLLWARFMEIAGGGEDAKPSIYIYNIHIIYYCVLVPSALGESKLIHRIYLTRNWNLKKVVGT